MNITEIELGWLVGILEGEGSFGYYGRTQRVSMEMTDKDTIERYVDIVGKVLSKDFAVSEFQRKHRVNYSFESTMYRLTLTGDNARQLMGFVVGLMSYRRRARIWQCLNGYTEKKKTLAELGIVISPRPYAKERMIA